jgi:hypothetical protein
MVILITGAAGFLGSVVDLEAARTDPLCSECPAGWTQVGIWHIHPEGNPINDADKGKRMDPDKDGDFDPQVVTMTRDNPNWPGGSETQWYNQATKSVFLR